MLLFPIVPAKVAARCAAGAAALLLSVAALAASPSLHEVYQAAEAGRMEQAQKMMDEVLREHPDSAKAYYVRAELYARQGQGAQARQALAQAERLQPGLPFADAKALRTLREQVAGLPASSAPALPAQRSGGMTAAGSTARTASGSGPWLPWLAGAGLALAAWLLWQRRPRREDGRGLAAPADAAPGWSTASGAAGHAPVSPYGANPAADGSGLGSRLAGGLATGVAVGAGVVAGQALMQRMMGGGEHGVASGGYAGGTTAGANPGDLAGALGDPAATWSAHGENADMGGNDFGIADASTWDDGGGGGGGGSDWS